MLLPRPGHALRHHGKKQLAQPRLDFTAPGVLGAVLGVRVTVQVPAAAMQELSEA